MAGVAAGPVPCPPDRGPCAGAKGMGRILLACPRSKILPRPTSRSEGPSAMADEDGDACDVQHGVTSYSRSGQGRGRHEPQAHAAVLCRSPLRA